MFRVLVCDDEPDIRSALRIYLSDEGYEVTEVADGADCLVKIKREEFHLVLLDVMMPLLDGMETLRQIRTFSNIPVIFLTAKGEDADKVLGLNCGADDYVTKPFNPAELLARVRSSIRRYTQLGARNAGDAHWRCGPIEMFDENKLVTRDGDPILLTPTEYDILRLLIRNPGRVYSPAEIYRNVWKEEIFGSEGTVAVHIRHLREKLEFNPAEPRYLLVVWGKGYKMEDRER
ncbi:MAG: response regulator transcription factor [Clostridia bacterium]|nr:response regulator transcription factor [Clostridia bacterium]